MRQAAVRTCIVAAADQEAKVYLAEGDVPSVPLARRMEKPGRMDRCLLRSLFEIQ